MWAALLGFHLRRGSKRPGWRRGGRASNVGHLGLVRGGQEDTKTHLRCTRLGINQKKGTQLHDDFTTMWRFSVL